MKEHFKLKVIDILHRKHFEKAIVIAGEDGLNRIVKWVHVVEVTNIRNLLNGNELILSTGVSWNENENLFISIVEQLIEFNAAGLCIELDTYLSEIPSGVIDIANLHHFPIIVFQKQVPFVEITQDIHSKLINQQYLMISDLEDYSQSLNKHLLTIDTYEDILQFIFSTLDIQIIFKVKNQEYEFVPDIHRQEKQEIVQRIESIDDLPNNEFAVAAIHLFGREFAELYIYSKEVPLSEFDLLILDRTSTALAQHLLRDLYVEERKRAEEFEWLSGWLEGEHSQDVISEYLQENNMKTKTNEAIVLIAKYTSNKDKTNQDVTYIKLLFRSVFEQHGFGVFSIEKRNKIIFILLNNRLNKSIKDRLKKAIEVMNDSEFMKKQTNVTINIAIGKSVDSVLEVHKSYHTAKETVHIQHKMPSKQMYYFYEDLHLYRLISLMSKHIDLQELVTEYLQPVIVYDKKYNGKLLETLKTYFECSGSKQETSKKLFIVRQTLYHRLQKLENLLGTDFMEHEKRIAIEFMLQVHDYLDPPHTKEDYQAR